MKIHTSLCSYAFSALLVALTARAVLAQVHVDGPNGIDGNVADLISNTGDCKDEGSREERVTVPKELASFVPSDATAVEWHRTDLNLDGRLDYFLVIEHHCDERTLLLVVRMESGALTLAASSDHLITCRTCGGQYSGYTGAHVQRGSFTIEQQDGSASGGQREKVTFVWSKARRTWAVSAADYFEYSSSGSEGGKDSKAVGVAIQDYQSHLATEGS